MTRIESVSKAQGAKKKWKEKAKQTADGNLGLLPPLPSPFWNQQMQPRLHVLEGIWGSGDTALAPWVLPLAILEEKYQSQLWYVR